MTRKLPTVEVVDGNVADALTRLPCPGCKGHHLQPPTDRLQRQSKCAACGRVAILFGHETRLGAG